MSEVKLRENNVWLMGTSRSAVEVYMRVIIGDVRGEYAHSDPERICLSIDHRVADNRWLDATL